MITTYIYYVHLKITRAEPHFQHVSASRPYYTYVLYGVSPAYFSIKHASYAYHRECVIKVYYGRNADAYCQV